MEKRAEIPGPDDFRFSCQIEPRFRDLDPMGHVNNAVYFTYFEIARTGYVKAIGHWPDDDRPMTERFPFIMLKIECTYLSAARVDEVLVAHLRTSRVGHKSFEFDYLLDSAKDGREVARGHSVQVFYDYPTGSTLPVSAHFLTLLETYEGRSLGR